MENGSWGNSSNETAYEEIIFWAYECIEMYPFQYPSATVALTNSQAFLKARNRIFVFLGTVIILGSLLRIRVDLFTRISGMLPAI